MLSNHVSIWLRRSKICESVLLGVAVLVTASVPLTAAQAAGGNTFSIQVSPSPLVVNPAPGETQTATLTLRNFSNHSETLRVGLTGLKIEEGGRKITPRGPVPGNMDSWVHFARSQLTIAPGASGTLGVTFAPPKNVGFSYAAAIALTSSDSTTQQATGTTIRPEIDVFCLVNINRDDAVAKLDVSSFRADKSHYSFLPANFDISIKNEGNIIAQPSGNVFIQRSFDDAVPTAVLPINNNGGYVLPGTARTFRSEWTAGFPSYVTTDGKIHLHWNWKHVSELRLGKYVAKAVVVYNNGHQDVPVITSFTFWVLPWWLIICTILLAIVLVMGLVGWGWLIFKGTKKVKGYAAHAHHKK